MFLGGFELSIVPDFGFMFESGGSLNYTGYSNEKTDELINVYRNSITENEMKENMKNLQMQVGEELPCIGITFRKAALFTDERITGDIVPIQFNAYNGIEKWVIN